MHTLLNNLLIFKMLDVREVLQGKMLIGYAKGELSPMHTEEITALLAHNLELGEELEKIYILLEQSGEDFSG